MELFWWPGPHAESAIAAVRKGVERVGNSYGMTEASGAITFTATDADDTALAKTVVHASCQLKPGFNVDHRELDAHVRTLRPSYKAPKTYATRDDLPLLANGKVDRKSLARQLRAEQEQGVHA